MEFIYVLIAITGLASIILLMLKPNIFTMLSIFLTVFQFNWFVRYYNAPAILNRATLVFVGLLGIRVLIHFLLNKPSIRCKNGVIIPLLILALFFTFITLISNLYNEEGLLPGFYSLRYFFVGFTLTLAIYLYLPQTLRIEKLKHYLSLLALIQLPVSVIKYIAADGGASYTLDSVSGTFAGYGELVICQIIALGIILTDKFVHKRNTLAFINTYLLSILFVSPLLLSKSRSASIFVIIVIVFVLVYSLFKRRNLTSSIKVLFSTSIIFLVFSSLFYIFFWQSGNYDLDKQFDPEFVYDYYMHPPNMNSEQLRAGADPKMGRFQAIATAWEYIQQDLAHSILGYGAGTASEASFIGINGRHFQKIGPLAGIARNQYSKSILEFGILGLLGFFIFFYSIGKRLKHAADSASSINTTYIIILFTLMILSSYTITLESFLFSFIIAFFLAVTHAEIADHAYDQYGL